MRHRRHNEASVYSQQMTVKDKKSATKHERSAAAVVADVIVKVRR